MDKKHSIPQYNLPTPKPNWNAHYWAQKQAREKLKRKTRQIVTSNNNTKGKIRYLYLLELEQGMFYIGSTGNVQRRFEAHRRGNGAKWTKLYKPIRVVEQRCLGRISAKNACILEQEMFDDYFLKYGYSLRGGGKCQVDPNW